MAVYIIYPADEESINKLPLINWIGRFVVKESNKDARVCGFCRNTNMCMCTG
jgi:hypothetical protein